MNIDYIIEKYCVNKDKPELQCNGKCHLAKTITPKIDLTKDDLKAVNIVSEAFFPVFHQKTDNYVAKDVIISHKNPAWNLNSLHSFQLIKGLEQPPDFHL